MAEKILKVTEEGEVYWMDGHNHQEAINSFGVQITSETFLAVPFDPNLTEFENIEQAWQKAVAELDE